MAEAIPVIVTVEDSAKLDEVRAASEKHGMKSVSMLRGLGMFKGLVHPNSIETISRISGVRSVEPERQNRILPRGPSVS
jgi:hypothetical protein